MPFKSEEQRRYLWANEPEIARDWTDTYGSRIQKNNGGITSTKTIRNQPHMLAYITPGEAKTLENLGGQKTMTAEGVPAYPESEYYGGTHGSSSGTNTSSGNPNEDRAREEYNAAANQQRSQTFDAIRDQQRRQDTITNQANTNYGQFFGSRVPVHTPTTLGQRIGQGVGNFASGVGDYIRSGGMWGALARGLGSLFPSTPSTGNVGPAGLKTDGTYGTVADAIRASRRNEPVENINDGRDTPWWQQLGYPSYEEWAASQNQGIAGIEVDDDAITLDDIVLRFQGADRTLNPQAVGLQDTDQLREMIQERVKNLYT